MNTALEFRDAVVTFDSGAGLLSKLGAARGSFNAVDHVSLDVRKGEILGVVGESGSGKTTICKAALGLHPISGGTITQHGKPLTLNDGSLQMVFQDPLSSLNPRQTVAKAIEVPLRLNRTDGTGIDDQIDTLLRDVGLTPQFRNRFPHELSGGQLQRVAIARALATNPKVLFADEAVSKLDVSVRAQVLNLLKKLRDSHNLTIIFVTHDLHVARFLCDRIAIMYFGKLLELGPTRTVYDSPSHPYTRELLGTLDRGRVTQASTRDVFNSMCDDLRACRFLNRCPHAVQACKELHPEHHEIAQEHSVACHLFDDEAVLL